MSNQGNTLTDTFGRRHNYLRISLTDACNFSCTYCVPAVLPEKEVQRNLMQADEIETLAKIFVEYGVTKIRLTGGEPLLRKDFSEILDRLSGLGITLTLTTNAYLADRYIESLKHVNVHSLNVSLDTFNRKKFIEIARFDGFNKVHENILQLIQEGFHVKLNCVLIRGVNDDEIYDFIEFSRYLPVHIRFIEYMPFSDTKWDHSKVIHSRELLEQIKNGYQLIKLPDEQHDTAKKFKIFGCKGTLAIITTVSEPFCDSCNRLRLTAKGHLRNCLFAQSHTDLLTALRQGENVRDLIEHNLKSKAWQYGGQQMQAEIKNSHMIQIGG